MTSRAAPTAPPATASRLPNSSDAAIVFARALRRPAAARPAFTYLGLLILVAILALATSATLTLGSIVQRREAEQRLLEVGDAYRQAIASYLHSSPAGNRRYPGARRLLKDPAIRAFAGTCGNSTRIRSPARTSGGWSGAGRRDHGRTQPLERETDQDRRVRAGERVFRGGCALFAMGVYRRADEPREQRDPRFGRRATGRKRGFVPGSKPVAAVVAGSRGHVRSAECCPCRRTTVSVEPFAERARALTAGLRRA
jgi:type II secretory pathway pseudopilin PulG